MDSSTARHPSSLAVFCGTEVWERYGFYVIQTLLAIYLTTHFKWSDQKIYLLVGSFTALTYLSPMVGGWIADRFLGQKQSILLGATILLGAYVLITFFQSEKILPLSLSAIAVGTGLLKPNISSLLGNEYKINSPHRERGFTIFYMGITFGIVLGTTLPSQIQQHFGWPAAFSSAAIGMVIALVFFYAGSQNYDIEDYEPRKTRPKDVIATVALLFCTAVFGYFVLTYPSLADIIFFLIFIVSFGYIAYTVYFEDKKQSLLTLVIGMLCLISIIFWTFYFQMFMSLTLFISRVVTPSLFGFDFPAPYYVCVQSVGMLVFGLLLTRNKRKLNRAESGYRTINKFTASIVVMLIAYSLITLVTYFTQYSNYFLSPFLIIPMYILISIAELLLSPIGLSAITTLAHRQKVSTMMGIFFVSLGIGGYLSGKLATLTALPSKNMSLIDLKVHYAHSFMQLLIVLSVSLALCGLINHLCRITLRHHEYYQKIAMDSK